MPRLPDNPVWGIAFDGASPRITQHTSPERGVLHPGSERTRAVDLHTLFLHMADPSREFLASVTGGLFGIVGTSTTREQIHEDISTIRRNPRGFFGNHGVVIEDSERLEAGIENFGELMDRIPLQYDDQSYEYTVSEDIDPNTYAAAMYERIQMRNGERSIRKRAQLVRREPDMQRRMHMGQVLRDEIVHHVTENPYTFYRVYGFDREDIIEPTWENITAGSGLLAQIDTHSIRSKGNFELEDAVTIAQAAIGRYPMDLRIEQIPKRDKERFNQLRYKYGAKAANLLLLSDLVTAINGVRENDLLGVSLAVPEFQTVPVDLYQAWQAGNLTDEALRPYYEWASDLRDDRRGHTEEKADFMVRSSAVFSEDGESITGAGIYDSVQVEAGSSFDVFRDAVTQVYESTNSPQALAYRAEQGIPDEEMGLVIQRFIPDNSYNSPSRTGYINSRLTGVPQLMEIATETSRNFIRRDALDFFLAIDPDTHEGAFASAHHFPPDLHMIDPNLPIRAALLMHVLERIWGRAIQAEFIAGSSARPINFVQVRELPESTLSQQSEVVFPDEQPIHTGAAVGVGDVTLSLLDTRNDNSDKVGVVVLPENHRWSLYGRLGDFPREGAVIIARSEGSNGHIQTLCAEKGLICVYPTAEDGEEVDFPEEAFSGLDRLRIVSNGIEARVYPPQSPQS